MTEQSLTLHDILVEPLRLLEMLEELQERDEGDDGSIAEIELALSAYIEATPAKVDNFAGFLKECEDRSEIAQREGERLIAIAKRWGSRKKYLEYRAIQAMQIIGKESVDGKFNTLALRKNNPSVEITQIGLIPMEYRRATITLDQETWEQIGKCLSNTKQHMLAQLLAGALLASKSEPKKAEIARVLKSTEPCPKCEGGGKIGLITHDEQQRPIASTWEVCDQCDGSGKVAKGVPGCMLKRSVSLEVK